MKYEPEERLYFDPHTLRRIERELATRRHIERYTMLRQWCHGVVIDCACGCGYGTNLISKNPDVSKAIGIDVSEEAISWANENFKEDNIEFICANMFNLQKLSADVLVSIETIEHIKKTDKYISALHKISANELILSYPTKKSTHYNRFHYYDFKYEEIEKLFLDIGYKIIQNIDLYHEVALLRMEKL
jgi:2-polyprenyl-3-methyl-5-hydroxy-6-metoxy-1,4-benzoquinol methylase